MQCGAPMKKFAPLPDGLRYLQPFVNSLAKLPADALNEDVDSARLDAALRKRLRGLTEVEADAVLSRDRDHLEAWLKASDSPDHPAYWVLGFLSFADLASQLTKPAEPPLRGPAISFASPDGWKVKVVPFRLDLRRGKVWASITASDQLGFEVHCRLDEHWAAPPELNMTLESKQVAFGPCQGKKFVITELVPAPWKSVRYALSVPGGYVSVDLGARDGADFDELPLEAALHTLQISSPG